MARLNSEESDDRKETTLAKKKSAAKKKSEPTGIWPCKMNGCTKQFAREADLKRHQKTTKLHSMPNFQCPQCEATFTRTDALRRHQKSRHNGVICEEMEQDDPEQSSRSSSAAPSSDKGKEPAVTPMTTLPQTIQGTPITSGPATGFTTYYYRPNSASYCPTSRNSSTGDQWSPPPQPPPGHTHMAYMYVPSPYHRPRVDGPPQPRQYALVPVGPSMVEANSDSTNTDMGSPSSSSTSSTRSRKGDKEPRLISPPTPAPAPAPARAPNSEPNPEPEPEPEEPSEPDKLDAEQIAQLLSGIARAQTAAAAAVLEDGQEPFHSQHDRGSDDEGDHDRLASLAGDNGSPGSLVMREHGYGSRLERPEPMEPLLTENGEPMLNPAELLTRVGWVALYDGPDGGSDDSVSISSQESLTVSDPS